MKKDKKFYIEAIKLDLLRVNKALERNAPDLESYAKMFLESALRAFENFEATREEQKVREEIRSLAEKFGPSEKTKKRLEQLLKIL